MSRSLDVRPLFSAEMVENRIAELGEQLYRDYANSPLLMLPIAVGAERFAGALLEELALRGLEPRVQRIRAHRSRGMQLEEVQLESFDVSILDGRDVLVVDDIADEGRTLRAVLQRVSLSECRSVRTAVLVNKLQRRREALHLDYVGFTVEQGWVVGFGMDVDGELRDLDEIGIAVDRQEAPSSRRRSRSKG